ncbi:MAG: NADH/ubiquinone/plastoquinone (complex I), partial [Mogibacterium diversum]|nr:NADH/ubiquinone/plastoquinone (complex I) [Mogibacterium diversum]
MVAISIFAAFVCSVKLLAEVIHDGAIRYTFGGYKAPYGIEFYIDSIGAIIVLIILLLGFITVLYTMNFEVTNERKVIGGAYALIGLLIVGMCGMTLTGDVFNLYVFLEITSLSGYCLIALGGSRGIVASFRYLLVGTVAATMYLLGVGILYASTGTLNMTDMRSILDSQDYTVQMTVSMCLFIGAFDIKMPMFPFHGWQPSAYAHAEPGSRPLIVGIMGKIPALAMFRYLYIIYGTDFKYFNLFLTIIGVLSCIGIIYGSIRAMAQEDIRKIFAYSSIAQIGYITLGFSIGNSYALAGAFLHLIGHVFMKSGLFFSSAAIRYRFGNFELSSFGRIYKKMPITSALIVLA